ncbi:TldD/PmbA family protein [Acidianus sulfidivorans JP7]|uniref:Zn-dependent protease n=1 Tax=Acidianus sulfidivorans JP7 TaxID=619593 RepID=A0A2U9INJ9_9CREN|nr:zinc metalloprotease TldD [Acidianus sulfidivorans]AWR97534.1 TldD/PmbA family protein [Acidianus sulfidivorans JP7]
MHELLLKAEKLGSMFADLRYYEVKELSISDTEQGVYISTNGSDIGYSLRVLYDGNWGYINATQLNGEDVKKAIDSAYGNGKVNITYLPPKKDEVKIRQTKEVNKSIEEIIKDLDSIKNRLLKQDPSIKSVNVRYFMSDIHKEYYSTEDREISQQYIINGIAISAVARVGDIVASAYHGASTFKGYPLEIFDENEMIQIIEKRLQNQLKGKVTKGGESEVVLAPDVVGVFSHEAVGHLAEADLAINGILSKLRGKKIAPDFVSIYDSPFIDYNRAIGITPYDDEGVEGRDVKIIDKGVVSEFLVDRYYSTYLGERPTGNARAEDFRSPILVRMRNTYMLSGEHSLDEMIKEVKEGYFLVSPLGGQTSPDGTFQFGIQEGYIIHNGEITEPLRNVGISGYTIETLGKIEAVSKEFDVWPGFCGKGGQSVPVGTGGAYIKVRMKVGGINA